MIAFIGPQLTSMGVAEKHLQNVHNSLLLLTSFPLAKTKHSSLKTQGKHTQKNTQKITKNTKTQFWM